MCFSAGGSFTLSGVLAAVGVASVVRNSSKEHAMLAAVPLVFAAQQFAEGMVWTTFRNAGAETAHQAAVMAFIAIAMAVWPIWAPLSLRLAERDRTAKRVLAALLGLGSIAAVVSVLLLLRRHPVAEIAGHSIRYEYPHSTNAVLSVGMLAGYIAPTIGPFFVSTMRAARMIGSTLVVSLALSIVVEREALASVWCFFAAILSVQILFALKREAPRAP
jgi:hypothetical protein